MFPFIFLLIHILLRKHNWKGGFKNDHLCLLTENKSSLHSGRVRKCPKTCLRNIWMVPKRAEQCFLFLLKVLWCTCVTKQLASSLKIIALYTMLDVCRIESSHSFHIQNMTNPTIMSPVKMEYGWNFSIFWPKNDDKKWSRKNIFEIPPCAHHVIFITEFVLLIKIQ